ncbi:hypothetical protein M8C21_000567 [Ambrosia artemisiifolia]|uniref:U6 snRNA-associated Sm-like protein LSm1 n=1 Tax=Ambrosia artemisiifolia TaxID=4212 RepID=A0AAD5GAX9_AMBAR|nr:hypothetical protein M8C21_000567 [Ambrosia artemisiifolia]
MEQQSINGVTTTPGWRLDEMTPLVTGAFYVIKIDRSERASLVVLRFKRDSVIIISLYIIAAGVGWGRHWEAAAAVNANLLTKNLRSMSWAGPEDIYLSTSLASYLDKKLLVLLRDGRKLLGILRSFDQFANAVIEGACERVIVGDLYCDIPLGLYVIRGENVVLIGELEMEKEELPPHMTRVSEVEIKRAQKVEREATDLKGTMRRRMEFLDMD